MTKGFNDSLGDRMKRYERASQHCLTPRMPVIIRIDGRAFHTYTKHMNQPFDGNFILCMQYAAIQTAKEMSGFKLAYVQSDECTFMLTDYDSLKTQGWFGYELNKIVSISASTFTAHFLMAALTNTEMPKVPVQFDSRAFNVPHDDAPNAFVWRYKDWLRNSYHMYARQHFSHKELQGKSQLDIHHMLIEQDLPSWGSLDEYERWGTVIDSSFNVRSMHLDYKIVESLIDLATV